LLSTITKLCFQDVEISPRRYRRYSREQLKFLLPQHRAAAKKRTTLRKYELILESGFELSRYIISKAVRKGRTKVAKFFLDWWLKTKDFKKLKNYGLLEDAEESGKLSMVKLINEYLPDQTLPGCRPIGPCCSMPGCEHIDILDYFNQVNGTYPTETINRSIRNFFSVYQNKINFVFILLPYFMLISVLMYLLWNKQNFFFLWNLKNFRLKNS